MVEQFVLCWKHRVVQCWLFPLTKLTCSLIINLNHMRLEATWFLLSRVVRVTQTVICFCSPVYLGWRHIGWWPDKGCFYFCQKHLCSTCFLWAEGTLCVFLDERAKLETKISTQSRKALNIKIFFMRPLPPRDDWWFHHHLQLLRTTINIISIEQTKKLIWLLELSDFIEGAL